MEAASADIEAEIAALGAEINNILQDLRGTVGDLSDLRYGRFNRPARGDESVRTEILGGLKRLENACDNAG